MQHRRQGAGADRPGAGQRAQVRDGVVQQVVGGRAEGQGQPRRGVGGRGRIHERRAISVEHRPEEALDEALVLLGPGDVALMGEQPVLEAVGPVEGGELLHRGVGAKWRRDSAWYPLSQAKSAG